MNTLAFGITLMFAITMYTFGCIVSFIVNTLYSREVAPIRKLLFIFELFVMTGVPLSACYLLAVGIN
jgi:hypothetical protein